MKNNNLEISKFFAIVSVVIAHYISDDFSMWSRLLQRVGTFGVPCFFFLSGYFYNIEKYGFLIFFKNKIKGILVPWVFTGTIVYLVTKKHFDIAEWIMWIAGIGTYLYYLSVLIFLFLLFSISLLRNKYILIVLILLNIVSLAITYLNHYNIYSYLNIFNWIGFFSLGMLAKGHLYNVITALKKYTYIIILLSIGIITYITLTIESNYAGYFSKYAFGLEILGGGVLLLISSYKVFNNKMILMVSKYSFSIYLIHFLFFPIKRIVPHNLLFEICTPILLTFLISILLYLGELVFSKIKYGGNLYNTLLGIR
ncbi:hypothetical protein ATE49_13880 [Elizabethkingia miricola]|uniref:Peptidoglycan/LPS O-acetylase OafA/YrhL n=1 Tax=Elizabethkingia miricola TaxID=172045 RepID=A0ABY3NEJ5_ELIMR|nr:MULTISPECIES: acyltransferase family protein [Elizabethkingia]OBS13150.1 hypothetical protein ATE49_13880 [Elizabethkingia miricola]TYO89749.1 peptidoglycan/LPS O-acetylase OafA/YrhL [Elizabethkingia miricola]